MADSRLTANISALKGLPSDSETAFLRITCDDLDGPLVESEDCQVTDEGRASILPALVYECSIAAPATQADKANITVKLYLKRKAGERPILYSSFDIPVKELANNPTWFTDEDKGVAIQVFRVFAAAKHAIEEIKHTVVESLKIAAVTADSVRDETETSSKVADETADYTHDFEADTSATSSHSNNNTNILTSVNTSAVVSVGDTTTSVMGADVAASTPHGGRGEHLAAEQPGNHTHNSVDDSIADGIIFNETMLSTSTQSSTVFSGILDGTKDDYSHMLSASALVVAERPTSSDNIAQEQPAVASSTAQQLALQKRMEALFEDHPPALIYRLLSSLWVACTIHGEHQHRVIWNPPGTDTIAAIAAAEPLCDLLRTIECTVNTAAAAVEISFKVAGVDKMQLLAAIESAIAAFDHAPMLQRDVWDVCVGAHDYHSLHTLALLELSLQALQQVAGDLLSDESDHRHWKVHFEHSSLTALRRSVGADALERLMKSIFFLPEGRFFSVSGNEAAISRETLYAVRRRWDAIKQLLSAVDSLKRGVMGAGGMTNVASSSRKTPFLLEINKAFHTGDTIDLVGALLPYAHLSQPITVDATPAKGKRVKGAKARVTKPGQSLQSLCDPLKYAACQNIAGAILHSYKRCDMRGKGVAGPDDIATYRATAGMPLESRSVSAISRYIATLDMDHDGSISWADFAGTLARSLISPLSPPEFVIIASARSTINKGKAPSTARVAPKAANVTRRYVDVKAVQEALPAARAGLDRELHSVLGTAISQCLLSSGTEDVVLMEGMKLESIAERVLNMPFADCTLSCIAGIGLLALTASRTMCMKALHSISTILIQFIARGSETAKFTLTMSSPVVSPAGVSVRPEGVLLPEDCINSASILPEWMCEVNGVNLILQAAGFEFTDGIWKLPAAAQSDMTSRVQLCLQLVNERAAIFESEGVMDAASLQLGAAELLFGSVDKGLGHLIHRRRHAWREYEDALEKASRAHAGASKRKGKSANDDPAIFAANAAAEVILQNNELDGLIAPVELSAKLLASLDLVQSALQAPSKNISENRMARIAFDAVNKVVFSHDDATQPNFSCQNILSAFGFFADLDAQAFVFDAIKYSSSCVAATLAALLPLIRAVHELARLLAAATITAPTDVTDSAAPAQSQSLHLKYVNSASAPAPLPAFLTGPAEKVLAQAAFAHSAPLDSPSLKGAPLLDSTYLASVGPQETAELVSKVLSSNDAQLVDSHKRIAQLESALADAQLQLRNRQIGELGSALKISLNPGVTPTLSTAAATLGIKLMSPPKTGPNLSTANRTIKPASSKRPLPAATFTSASIGQSAHAILREPAVAGTTVLSLRLHGDFTCHAGSCVKGNGADQLHVFKKVVRLCGDDVEVNLLQPTECALALGSILEKCEPTPDLQKAFNVYIMSSFVEDEFLPTLCDKVLAAAEKGKDRMRTSIAQFHLASDSGALVHDKYPTRIMGGSHEGRIFSSIAAPVCIDRLAKELVSEYFPGQELAIMFPMKMFDFLDPIGTGSVQLGDLQRLISRAPSMASLLSSQQPVFTHSLAQHARCGYPTMSFVWSRIIDALAGLVAERPAVISSHTFGCFFRPLHPLDHILLPEDQIDLLAAAHFMPDSDILQSTSVEFWGEQWEKARSLLPVEAGQDSLHSIACIFAAIHAMQAVHNCTSAAARGLSTLGLRMLIVLCDGECLDDDLPQRLAREVGITNTEYFTLSDCVAIRLQLSQRLDGMEPSNGHVRLAMARRHAIAKPGAPLRLCVQTALKSVYSDMRRALLTDSCNISGEDIAVAMLTHPMTRSLCRCPLLISGAAETSLFEVVKQSSRTMSTWKDLSDSLTMDVVHITEEAVFFNCSAAQQSCLEAYGTPDGSDVFALTDQGYICKFSVGTGDMVWREHIVSEDIIQFYRHSRYKMLTVLDTSYWGRTTHATPGAIQSLMLNLTPFEESCPASDVTSVGCSHRGGIVLLADNGCYCKHSSSIQPHMHLATEGADHVTQATTSESDDSVRLWASELSPMTKCTFAAVCHTHSRSASDLAWPRILVIDGLSGAAVADFGYVGAVNYFHHPVWLGGGYVAAFTSSYDKGAATTLTVWSASDAVESALRQRSTLLRSELHKTSPANTTCRQIASLECREFVGVQPDAAVIDMVSLSCVAGVAVLTATGEVVLARLQVPVGGRDHGLHQLVVCDHFMAFEGYKSCNIVGMSKMVLPYNSNCGPNLPSRLTLQPSVLMALEAQRGMEGSALVMYVLHDYTAIFIPVHAQYVDYRWLTLEDSVFLESMSPFIPNSSLVQLQHVLASRYRVLGSAILLSKTAKEGFAECFCTLQLESVRTLYAESADASATAHFALLEDLLRHYALSTGQHVEMRKAVNAMGRLWEGHGVDSALPFLIFPTSFAAYTSVHCPVREDNAFDVLDFCAHIENVGLMYARSYIALATFTSLSKNMDLQGMPGKKRGQVSGHAATTAAFAFSKSAMSQSVVAALTREYRYAYGAEMFRALALPGEQRMVALRAVCDSLCRYREPATRKRALSVLSNLRDLAGVSADGCSSVDELANLAWQFSEIREVIGLAFRQPAALRCDLPVLDDSLPVDFELIALTISLQPLLTNTAIALRSMVHPRARADLVARRLVAENGLVDQDMAQLGSSLPFDKGYMESRQLVHAKDVGLRFWERLRTSSTDFVQALAHSIACPNNLRRSLEDVGVSICRSSFSHLPAIAALWRSSHAASVLLLEGADLFAAEDADFGDAEEPTDHDDNHAPQMLCTLHASLCTLTEGPDAIHNWTGSFKAVCDAVVRSTARQWELLPVGFLETLTAVAIVAVKKIIACPVATTADGELIMCPLLELYAASLRQASTLQSLPNRVLRCFVRLASGEVCDAISKCPVQQSYIAAFQERFGTFLLTVFGIDGRGSAEFPGLQVMHRKPDASTEQIVSALDSILDCPLAKSFHGILNGARAMQAFQRRTNQGTASKSALVMREGASFEQTWRAFLGKHLAEQTAQSASLVSTLDMETCKFMRDSFYFKQLPSLLEAIANLHAGTPDPLLDTSDTNSTSKKGSSVLQHARTMEKVGLRKQAAAKFGFILRSLESSDALIGSASALAMLLTDFDVPSQLVALLHDPELNVQVMALESLANFSEWVGRCCRPVLVSSALPGAAVSETCTLFVNMLHRLASMDCMMVLVRRLLVYWQVCVSAGEVSKVQGDLAALRTAALLCTRILYVQLQLRIFSASVWRACGMAPTLVRLSKPTITKGPGKVHQDSVSACANDILTLMIHTVDHESIVKFVRCDSSLVGWCASTHPGMQVDLRTSWGALVEFLSRSISHYMESSSEVEDAGFSIPREDVQISKLVDQARSLNVLFPSLRRNFGSVFMSRSFTSSSTDMDQVESIVMSLWGIAVVCWRSLQNIATNHSGRPVLCKIVMNMCDLVGDALGVDLPCLRFILGDAGMLDTVLNHSIPGIDFFIEVLSTPLELNPFAADVALLTQAKLCDFFGNMMASVVMWVHHKSSQAASLVPHGILLLEYMQNAGIVDATFKYLLESTSLLHKIVELKVVHLHLLSSEGEYLARSFAGRSLLFGSLFAMVFLPCATKFQSRMVARLEAVSNNIVASEAFRNLVRYVMTDMLDDDLFLDVSGSSVPTAAAQIAGRHPLRLEAAAYVWMIGAIMHLTRRMNAEPTSIIVSVQELLINEVARADLIRQERARLWKYKDSALQPTVCAVLQALIFTGITTADSTLHNDMCSVAVPSAAVVWDRQLSVTVSQQEGPASNLAGLQHAALTAWSNWRLEKLASAPFEASAPSPGRRAGVDGGSGLPLAASLKIASRLAVSLAKPLSSSWSRTEAVAPPSAPKAAHESVSEFQFDIVKITTSVLERLGDAIVDVKSCFDAAAVPDQFGRMSVPCTFQAVSRMIKSAGFPYEASTHERVMDILKGSQRMSFTQYLCAVGTVMDIHGIPSLV